MSFNVTTKQLHVLMIQITKTMIPVGHQPVPRTSFCALKAQTVFGRLGFVIKRRIVLEGRTSLQKSVQIDPFVTKTSSGRDKKLSNRSGLLKGSFKIFRKKGMGGCKILIVTTQVREITF